LEVLVVGIVADGMVVIGGLDEVDAGDVNAGLAGCGMCVVGPGEVYELEEVEEEAVFWVGEVVTWSDGLRDDADGAAVFIVRCGGDFDVDCLDGGVDAVEEGDWKCDVVLLA
jgi:hypothetical protein